MAITRIKSDRIFTPDGFRSGYVYFDEQQILQVASEQLPFDREIDAAGLILSPGFIDIHVHGAAGIDFSQATAEEMAKAIDCHLKHGTTTLLPTVTSVPRDTLCKALEQFRICKTRRLSPARLPGMHLEGPYFSPAKSGAQSQDVISPPKKQDYSYVTEHYGDLIKRWSFAPELPGGMEFCRYLHSHNILPAVGHSDATYEECVTAFNLGCRLITHLYSCTSTIVRKNSYRTLGIVEAAWLMDDMYAEIIADGCHLPPELIRMIVKIKGPDTVCLITDALSVTCSDLSTSTVGDVAYIVEDGVAKLPDRSAFAGSIATADRLIRTCVQEAGLPLETALTMLTRTPARLLGLNAGVLQPGALPDLVIFDDNINIHSVFVGGKKII